MRSTTLVDLDLTVTIPPELKGVERHSVLITCRGFIYWDFMTCEDEGSFPLVSRMQKHQNLFTLNRLIHRAHRGFVYRDFMTCEDEGSCPLVSRMPKCRNLFTLKRLITECIGVSYTGILRLAKTRGLALWFPRCRNVETYSH
jgi:hypothetical protein